MKLVMLEQPGHLYDSIPFNAIQENTGKTKLDV